MSLHTQFLFDLPQQEIASLLRETIKSCQSLSIVTGFATVEGLKVLLPELSANPHKLKTLIVGSGTYRGFEVMDELLGQNIAEDRLYVHMGHTRETKPGKKHAFYRYHPMLHSKIYYFEMPNGQAVAFVGSHNLTGFALFGLNGEASVKVEGDINHPEIQKIRHHIEFSQSQATQYSPFMKRAYTWWSSQFVDGLRSKINDSRPFENEQTIVILTEAQNGDLPRTDDVVYFEIPAALGQLRTLNTEVHIYVYEPLPTRPQVALHSLEEAKATFWCRISGLEAEQGGMELNADWFIEDRRTPVLKRAPKPFRPNTLGGMQQVSVTVKYQVRDSFEYLFDREITKWKPILKKQERIQAAIQETKFLKPLKLVPPEDLEWYQVVDLVAEDERKENEAYKEALRTLSPQANSFILLSMRRRKI